MRTRTRHRWLMWLLPLMLLRAFVPAGFMLSWSDGGPQIVLCSGTGPVPVQAASLQGHEPGAYHEHAHHQTSQPASEHDHPPGQAHDASMCPFAGAGPAQAPFQAGALADPTLLPLYKIDFPSHPELRSASLFIDRIRGPPAV